jgi:RNA polymerase sigma factor for flagellar operon FliA
MHESEDAKSRWTAFLSHRSDRDREWLIEYYKPLVDSIQRRFRNVRPQDREDLLGAGYLGLVKSVDQWNPSLMPWLEFARFRVRAAMIDHIRDCDWVPKSVRSASRRIEGAEETLAGQLGRPPTSGELAAALNTTVDELEENMATLRGTEWAVASLDHTPDGEGSWLEALADPGAETPEQTTVRREDLDALELILQRLPGRLRRILKWRFLDTPRMSQKQIAAELGVHESRISQLLDSAFEQARKLSLQPAVLFGEVYEEGGRLTCRE